LQAGDDFGVQGAVRLFCGLLYLGAEGWRHAQLELRVSAAHWFTSGFALRRRRLQVAQLSMLSWLVSSA
jgi:hypothetical protein